EISDPSIMNPTKLTVVGLVLLVLLAGCISGLPNGGPNGGDTDASDDTGGTNNTGNTGADGRDKNGKNETDSIECRERGKGDANTSAETVTAFFVVKGEVRGNVTLEIADSPEERRKGLMHRKSLGWRQGMIFVYSNEGDRAFWMKNTYIPLDMIFVDANKTVINVEHADPQPNASDSELKRYRSEAPAQYVIEVNQGFADCFGIGKGTRVVFDLNGSASG
ncbi:MAG: DUF192 domain-containing protein, partial [Halobacteria archaeon]|nr:DUF192 domain-containing protein [Halobacteria archaeon]